MAEDRPMHGIINVYRCLALVLIFSAVLVSTSAEIGSKWLTLLSGTEEFEVTKEGWVYQCSAREKFTDGSVILGLEASPYMPTGEVLVCVYASMEDIRGRRLAEITRMSVITDDGIWSWHSLLQSGGGSFALLGAPEQDFLMALSETHTLRLQVHFLTRHMIVSFSEVETERLRAAARNLLPVLEAVDRKSVV